MAVIYKVLREFRGLLWDFKVIQNGYDDEKPEKTLKTPSSVLSDEIRISIIQFSLLLLSKLFGRPDFFKKFARLVFVREGLIVL